MQSLLKEIWYGQVCPMENLNGEGRIAERKRLSHLMSGYVEKFSKGMDEEKLKCVEKYDSCVTELIAICEEVSFIKGLRFAARFFTEALGDD